MITLPIDSILQFNGNAVTDHGRKNLSVDTEKIMNEARMVDGTLRRYVVSEKRSWSTSWEDLFSSDDYVADGFWAGDSLKDFYYSTPGEFDLTITTGDGEVETVRVMFKSFSYNIERRTPKFDILTMDIEMTEV